MNIRRVLLALAFAAFVLEAAITTWVVGVGGTVTALMANPVTRFVTMEVALCLVMLCVWMARDASARGINVWPFIGATLLLGGGGPLLYFVMHPHKTGADEQAPGLAAQQPARA